MYNYWDLIQAVNDLGTKIDLLYSYLQSTLTPILYIILFAVLLKVGFHCIRGYKA